MSVGGRHHACRHVRLPLWPPLYIGPPHPFCRSPALAAPCVPPTAPSAGVSPQAALMRSTPRRLARPRPRPRPRPRHRRRQAHRPPHDADRRRALHHPSRPPFQPPSQLPFQPPSQWTRLWARLTSCDLPRWTFQTRMPFRQPRMRIDHRMAWWRTLPAASMMVPCRLRQPSMVVRCRLRQPSMVTHNLRLARSARAQHP